MTSSGFVEVTYNIVALFGLVIIIYVMQKVETDRISRIDHPYVNNFRRLAFIVSALALCYSVISPHWNRTLPILALVSAGVLNLAVSAVSLYMRSPPTPGNRARIHSPRAARFLSRVIHLFTTHR